MVSTHVICIAFLGSKEPMFSDSLYLHSDNKGAAIMCSHFAVLLIDFPICLSFLSVNCLFQESKFTYSCLLKFWHKLLLKLWMGLLLSRSQQRCNVFQPIQELPKVTIDS